MVTVGLPVYNAERFLRQAIDSILSQKDIIIELIIINDGSTDGSMEIINQYSDYENIKIYDDGLNKGLATRLNEIIHLSSFNYIARMDSDDISLNNRLYEQIKFLEFNKNYDLVCSKVECIDHKGDHIGYRGCCVNNYSFYSIISGKSGIVHPTIVARKSWYERNLYNNNNYRAEDYELWLRAYIKDDLKVYCLKDVFLKYRVFPSEDFSKRFNSYKDQIKFITKIVFKIVPKRFFLLSFCMLFIILLKLFYMKLLIVLKDSKL